MSKLTQEQKLEQGISLSPAQLQAIKLLELTSLELDQRIERELEENPALEENYESIDNQTNSEENQDWDLGDYATEDDIPPYRLQEIHQKQIRKEEVPFSASAPTVDELLMEQLSMTKLSEEEEQLAKYIIGNITSDGYLERSVYQIQDDLLFNVGLDVSEGSIRQMIRRIQGLDPAGIAAKDLQECLILQLQRRQETSEVRLALAVLRHHYEDFVSKRFDRLCEKLEISSDELSEVYTLISKLNPKPTAGLGNDEEQRMLQYAPDFIVTEQEGELIVSLAYERELTPLRLSPTYLAVLSEEQNRQGDKQQKDAMAFLKHKIDQARWFIDAITQRQHTLRLVMNAIVEHQYQFFLTGELTELKPMVLRELAERTKLDISTISRVTSSKSVQTDYGVYPLKFFFGEGITNQDGEEISTRPIKQALQRLINDEDKSSPYTDAQLVEELTKLGYPLARRTVAKYREQLRLPVARLRREL